MALGAWRKDQGKREHAPVDDVRRKRVLRAGTFQILWALSLVYLILLGIAFLFGREVGYELSFGVCMGVAGLVTASFAAVYILDRGIAAIVHRFSRSITYGRKRNSERRETKR